MAFTKIGTFVKIQVDSLFLIGEMANSITTAISLIDVSSKSDCKYSAAEAGRVVETGSFSSIASSDHDQAAAENWNQLHAKAIAGEAIPVEITQVDCETGTPEAGAINIRGNVLISNLTLDNPDQATSTFSCDYQFVTELEIEANPVAS